ncbi:MAG TPA: TAXI family TRAP transporter solute-binding subunit [Clostridiales bacterium]|nr:TAXI family TRAP transporter solute-binding subunit [Clostridiales bacterium]
MKRKAISIISLVLILTLVFSACGKSGSGGDKDSSGGGSSVSLKFATGGTTGTYYAFGGIISQVLQDNIEGLSATIHSSGASKANIFELVDGDADIALVQNDVAHYAYTGTDLFEADGAEQGFSIVAGLYAEVCQVVTTKNITSIDQLKDKRVSVGDTGSGTEFNAKQILEVYGISFDDIDKHNLSFGDSANALKDGKIDAFFCVAGAPTTAIVDLSTTNSINILEVDDEHAAQLKENYGFYSQYTIPGGSYKGVDQDVKTVAVKATLVASNKLSEDVIYSITKTLFEKKDDIAAGHDKGKELSVENAVEGFSSVPFHPGAEKYYKEIGVIQ